MDTSDMQSVKYGPVDIPLDEVFTQALVIDDVNFSLAGFVSTHDGRMVTGSAADAAGSISASLDVSSRAYMELLERVATLAAESRTESTWEAQDADGRVIDTITHAELFPPDRSPEQRRRSKSNGIAAHTDWQAACRSARAEVIERDRILGVWHEELGATTLPSALGAFDWLRLAAHYEVRFLSFGDASNDPVVACFAFPRHAAAPMTYGFGCRDNLAEAVRAAESECLQRMCFLWGEELPNAAPMPSPTPDFHQDYYLTAEGRQELAAWLDRVTGKSVANDEVPQLAFVDITPVAWRGKMHVVKCHAPKLRALEFGLDPDSGVHPIA